MARVLAVFLLLGLTIADSPAPIVENPAVTPATIKPKPKATKTHDNKPSSATPNFAGTWRTTVTTRGEQSTTVVEMTLVIQQQSASITQTVTNILTGGESWNSVAEEYNTVRQFSLTNVWTSTDLVTEGTTLRIHWPVGRTIDWSPKTIPFSAFQSLAVAAPGVNVFTLHGDQLTREFDKPGNPTLYRVKASRK